MWGDTFVSLKLIASGDKRKLGPCHRIVVSLYFGASVIKCVYAA